MEKTPNRVYTAKDVYKIVKQGVREIVWKGVLFDVYAFDKDNIWLYDETDNELYTTNEKIAQSLNNGDTVEFYKLEKMEI